MRRGFFAHGARRAAMLAVLLAAVTGTVFAQPQVRAAEYRVKAAFLFKFLAFIEWPPQVFEQADSPLVIGVMNADELADELADVVATRHVRGHPVSSRKLLPGQPITGLHVLFVGHGGGPRVADVLDAARGRPLLTVTESDEAFAGGSAINFVVVDNKVRFDVALRPAEEGHLKISSRLLAVARRVLPGAS